MLKLIHQQKQKSIQPRPIFLLCVLRDEHLLLEYFIKYYQSLGVTHFIMIDNLSEDEGPGYLKSLENINLWLYRTEDSYKDAAYGTTWINQLLQAHCQGQYCFTVDIDELFMVDIKKYQSLSHLVDEMETVNSNVVPVTLLDMYPKKTNDNYLRGQNFLDHSPYFDDLNTTYYEERAPIYKNFVHKVGGVRKRVFGTTVCIHKFPFFKYDFYPLEVAPGYHFFQEDGKVFHQSEKIRLHDKPGLLLHFKFIKPKLAEFIQSRIKNNQDWNNSAEYRSYLRVLERQQELFFYDVKYSKKFITIRDLEQFF